MIVVKSINEWRTIRKSLINRTIGFVPTMGAIHRGHVSLIERSADECEISVVSIFVNPTQFDNAEDLNNYPAAPEKDIEKLSGLNVDYLLLPDYEMLYPDNFRYKIEETELSSELCGAHRPGHFTGVLTIVMKLLNFVQPQFAYFGEKDFQQFMMIKEMAHAFFMDVEIVSCPIVREEDGLAMSSRNLRLTVGEREKAPMFHALLKGSGADSEIAEQLTDAGFNVDYVTTKWGRRFGAVYLGRIRLIDNVEK